MSGWGFRDRDGNIDWTEDLCARLRELWAGTDSTAEIGRKMGITKNAVVGKAKRLDLPSRPSPIIRTGRPQPAPKAKRVQGRSLALPPSLAAAIAAEKATEREMVAKLSALVATVVEVVPEREALRVAFKPPAPRQCCWPMWGDHQRPTHQFCEAVAVLGKSYCREHHRRAYTKPAPEGADLAPWLPKRQGVAGSGGVGFV